MKGIVLFPLSPQGPIQARNPIKATPRVTVPITPKLSSQARSRPVTAESQAVKQEKEMEEIKAYVSLSFVIFCSLSLALLQMGILRVVTVCFVFIYPVFYQAVPCH